MLVRLSGNLPINSSKPVAQIAPDDTDRPLESSCGAIPNIQYFERPIIQCFPLTDK